jgi:hypothetical protein
MLSDILSYLILSFAVPALLALAAPKVRRGGRRRWR